MDFVLRYNGELHAPRGNADERQRIRMHFNRQLEQLCLREEFFSAASARPLKQATIRDRFLEVERPIEGLPFFGANVGGWEFVPLLNRPHELGCSLEITWLRHEKVGSIVSAGDLDNRLKSLVDALRMPHREDEVGRRPATDGERCYCLLEDDALITKFSVATYQTLEPAEVGEQNHVDLLIHVNVHSLYPMWANLTV